MLDNTHHNLMQNNTDDTDSTMTNVEHTPDFIL